MEYTVGVFFVRVLLSFAHDGRHLQKFMRKTDNGDRFGYLMLDHCLTRNRIWGNALHTEVPDK